MRGGGGAARAHELDQLAELRGGILLADGKEVRQACRADAQLRGGVPTTSPVSATFASAKVLRNVLVDDVTYEYVWMNLI